MTWVSENVPSAEDQLAFLTNLQRLFAEGDFSSTYKFALLISLADLAVERGVDNGATVTLSLHQIADRFIQLYWNQAAPYRAGDAGAATGVLVQNRGAQAAVVRHLAAFRQTTGAGTLIAAQRSTVYQSLVKDVAATVSAQPLTYLQNFGGATYPFLYERANGSVTLKPGMAYCLRRFYPLVQQLARSHWVDFIKANRQNRPMLGEADDLQEFLFESSRQSLAVVCSHLMRMDDGQCFYCGRRVTEAQVDHYIPFALYPRDLAHNFVLAHPKCNGSKSDTLAALPHLERWLDRLVRRADDLTEIGEKAGMAADADTTRRVARWGYANAVQANARAWVAPAQFETVDESYLAALSV